MVERMAATMVPSMVCEWDLMMDQKTVFLMALQLADLMDDLLVVL